jgi:hypothetical protein
VFTKLDTAVIDEELDRLRHKGDPE